MTGLMGSPLSDVSSSTPTKDMDHKPHMKDLYLKLCINRGVRKASESTPRIASYDTIKMDREDLEAVRRLWDKNIDQVRPNYLKINSSFSPDE